MPVSNFTHGRILILSGDSVPLSHTADFIDASLTWAPGLRSKVVAMNRGSLTNAQVVPGVEATSTFSFSATFVDELLLRVLTQGVWPATAESLTGLTGGANNADVVLTYRMEQNSLQFATGETGTKLAIGVTPSSDNEFSETLGGVHPDSLTSVPTFGTALSAGSLDVQQPSADTTRDVVYDAIGLSTLNATGDTCGQRTFLLRIEILNSCDPTDVVRRFDFDDAWIDTASVTEAEDINTITFEGQALVLRPAITNP